MAYQSKQGMIVVGESMSAGRMYDLIGKKAQGKIVAVLPMGVLCKLKKD